MGSSFRIVGIQIGVLALIFLLGMWINLFVTIPTTVAETFWTSNDGHVVTIHALLGIVAGIISILIFRNFRKSDDKALRSRALFGLVAVWLAIVGGASFITNTTNNWYSYLMAIAFLAAFASYVFMIARSM